MKPSNVSVMLHRESRGYEATEHACSTQRTRRRLTLPAGSSHTAWSAWSGPEPEGRGCRSHGPLSEERKRRGGTRRRFPQLNYTCYQRQHPWMLPETFFIQVQDIQGFHRKILEESQLCHGVATQMNLQGGSSVAEQGPPCSGRCVQTWTELPAQSASGVVPEVNLHR